MTGASTIKHEQNSIKPVLVSFTASNVLQPPNYTPTYRNIMGHFSHSDQKTSSDPPAYPTPPPASMSSSGGYQAPLGQFGLSFACLLLSRSDRVRIIGFPANVIPAVEEAIARVWVPGISSKGNYDGGGYEWKLSGRPCESFSFFQHGPQLARWIISYIGCNIFN